jgi:hypothetical protein
MANPWLAHVKATMKKHKGMQFKKVLKMAKKTYKKIGKSSSASPKKRRRTKRRRKSKGRKSRGRKKKTKRRRRRKR